MSTKTRTGQVGQLLAAIEDQLLDVAALLSKRSEQGKEKGRCEGEDIKKMIAHLDKEGLKVESMERAEKKIIWLLQDKHLRKEKEGMRNRKRRMTVAEERREDKGDRTKKARDRFFITLNYIKLQRKTQNL